MGLTKDLGALPRLITISSDNNVGINNTLPGNFRLDVSGTTRISGELTLNSTISNGQYVYTLPGSTGVLALTSQLHNPVTIGSPANGLSLSGQVLSLALSGPTTRGALTSEDYNYFFDKVQGNGNQNYLPKYIFSGSGKQIGNSQIYDNGTNVLIGTTTNSGYKLDVNGTGRFSGSITSITSFRINKSDGSTLGATFEYDSAINQAYIYNHVTGGFFSIYTNGSERLQISSTGVSTFNGNIQIINSNVLNLGYNQGGGATLKYNSNGNLDITPRSGYNTIFTSGNVGINTTEPRSVFEISQTLPFQTISSGLASESSTPDQPLSGINFYKHYGIAYSASIKLLQSGGPNNYSNAHLAFYTADSANPYTVAPSERMRITSGGNVLIGTTTDAGYKIDVNGSVRATSLLASTWVGAQGVRINSAPVTQGVYLGNSGTATNDYATIEMVGGVTGGCEIDFTSPNVDRKGRIGYNNYLNYMWFETASGTEQMRLTPNGELLIGRTTGYSAGWQLAVEGNIYAKYDIRADGGASFGGNLLIGTTTDNGNKLQVAGRMESQNFRKLSLALQTTPQSLGLPINAYSGGSAYLLLISTQFDAGNGTGAALWMIRCGYNGNNFEATQISVSNTASGISFSQVNGILHISGNTNWAAHIQVISNNLLF